MTALASSDDSDRLLGAYLRAGRSQKHAAQALGIPVRTAENRIAALLTELLPELTGQPATTLHRRLAQVEADRAGLARELDALRAEAISTAGVRALLDEVLGAARRPESLPLLKSPKGSPKTGVGLLLLSDLHYGELVDPAQVDGVNAYNLKIARRRIQTAFELSVDLLQHHTGSEYAGIVVALGGDLLNGYIHSELIETAEQTTPRDFLDCFALLQDGLTYLADHFGQVRVYSVVGNHGRLEPRGYGRAKHRQEMSFEWLLVQTLARKLAHDNRISFTAAEASDISFDVLGTQFVLLHGDEARGGTGWGGLMSPIRRLVGSLKSREMALSRRVDYFLLGHWHQFWVGGDMVINGTSKGFCEFARLIRADPQTPRQALMVVHPGLGMTDIRPLLLDRTDKLPHGRTWAHFERGSL